ncbi:MAG: HAD family hydrolase [Candidatus Bathyarchaeia archaeon]
MIKAVVFDLDGTIVDFNLDYKAVRAEVIRFLTQQGLPSSILSLNESIFEMLKKGEICMRNNGKGEREIARVREAVLSLADRYELEAAHTTSLLPGVIETLKALREMKLKTALFTINSEKSTGYILECFRLKSFFDAIITRESVSAVKPDPAHLEAALRALNVKAEEAMVVGDGVGDMKCARGLDVIAVGVTTGLSSPEELTRAGATYLISSFTDLITLVRRLNKLRTSRSVDKP